MTLQQAKGCMKHRQPVYFASAWWYIMRIIDLNKAELGPYGYPYVSRYVRANIGDIS